MWSICDVLPFSPGIITSSITPPPYLLTNLYNLFETFLSPILPLTEGRDKMIEAVKITTKVIIKAIKKVAKLNWPDVDPIADEKAAANKTDSITASLNI